MAATNASKMAAAKKDVVTDVKEIGEHLEDLVERSADLVELKASWIMRNPKAAAMTAGTIGVLSGALVCYLVVNSRLKTKYQKFADKQIADVKDHYAIIRKEGENGDLEALAARYSDKEREAVDEIINAEGYKSYDRVPAADEPDEGPVEEEITVTQAIVEATTIQRNVFESDNPDTYFDFDEELKRRNERPDDPFVITKEEFDQGEADFEQATLTYYDGDDVLADVKDAPIDNKDATIGFENLLRFGHGSGDPNIVYIRNPQLELDFEVVHSDGKFAKEVLGFNDELRHSHRRPQRKFRPSDE